MIFTELALGELPDTDIHITLKNGRLMYDGETFVKLVGTTITDVDDIYFLIVA